VSHVIIDGEVVVAGRSRQTPPARIRPLYFCCDAVGAPRLMPPR
jgi:enamidase